MQAHDPGNPTLGATPTWPVIAAKITVIYLAVGTVWIAVSDELLATFVTNTTTLTALQSIKGWFYVLATGVLLFLLLKKYLTSQETARQDAERLASFPRLNPTPIVEADSTGAITYANDAARETVKALGAGEDLRILLPPDMKKILEGLPTRKPAHFYNELEVNGRVFGEEVHIVPQIDTVRIYATDITTRKAMERESEGHARQALSIIDAFGEGITLADANGRFEMYNSRMEFITGYTMNEANSAADFFSLLYPEEDDRRQAMETIYGTSKIGKPMEIETTICCKNGLRKTLLVSNLRVQLNNREMYLNSYRDITGRKQIEESIIASLHEKEVLLKEIHHRVRNNLQVISSFLNLQAERMEEKEMAAIIRVSHNRVRSMAMVHESLYQSKDLARIDFGDYLNQLTSSLTQSPGTGAARICVNVACDRILLGVDTAIPCGLIINELVSNAMKHAFPEGRKGTIDVVFRKTEGNGYELQVSDNGVGFPGETDGTPGAVPGLGLDIVKSLSRQLNSTLEFDNSWGTAVRMTFHESAREIAVGAL